MWGSKKTDEGNTASPFPGFSAGLQEARPLNPGNLNPGNLNKDAQGLTGAARGSATAGLGANLRMKGEITGSQDLVIEGTFEGLVHLDEGKLTIGKTGKVAADIVASEVVVWGCVKGNVRAKNRIEIKKDGSVTGDLTTQQILIEVGAIYKGSIETETVEKGGDDMSALSSVAPAPAPPTAAA